MPGRTAAIAACALAAACAAREAEGRRGGSELRIWMPVLVHWEPGRRRALEFAIENPSYSTVAIARPHPGGARVDVYAGGEPIRVCGVVPTARLAPQPRIVLGPGERVDLRVDLESACGGVPPGEYRFEVSYRTGVAEGGTAFAGTLSARYGQVIVEARAPSAERR